MYGWMNLCMHVSTQVNICVCVGGVIGANYLSIFIYVTIYVSPNAKKQGKTHDNWQRVAPKVVSAMSIYM